MAQRPEVPWGALVGTTPSSCGRVARSSRGSDATGGAAATPSKIVASTPSRIINIRTPLRPCSKQRSKEFQDDIRCALEEQSAELLRVAFQRRHACPRDHALHEAVRQVSYGPERLQQGDLVIPEGPNPRGIVMLIHGGFWKAGFDRSLMVKIADDLVSKNFCVWNVGSGGGFPETLQDLHLALQWLSTPQASQLLKTAELPLALLGHSAGGHLATWLGLQQGLEKPMFPKEARAASLVISQAGVVDLVSAYEANLGQGAVRDFLGSSVPSTSSQLLAASQGAFMDLLLGPAEDAAERFAAADPTQLLGQVGKMEKIPTVVLVHGQQDMIVPLEQSSNFHKAFVKALPDAPRCILKDVPGEAHFEHLQPDSQLWSAAGNCAAVRLLLENSAEPNDRCLAFDTGEFPLQLALSTNMLRSPERLQMTEMLLKARADVGQRRNDPEGHTPLHDGVRRGDPGVVLLLLKHRADPNATNAFGEAPLELAMRGSFYTDVNESFTLVETLIQWGACPVLPGQVAEHEDMTQLHQYR
eukprot:s399_g10.t2